MSNRKTKARTGAGVLIIAVCAMLGGGFLLGPALGQDAPSEPTTTDSPAKSATEGRATNTVSRGTLTEEKEGTGSISYGESWAAPLDATGVVTQSHKDGTIIESGEPLIWLDTKPVVLATGDVPVYREMFYGRDAKRKLQSGDDITQLQEFLLDQGFTDKDRLTADGEFGPNTQRAVKAWQKASGLAETGRIDRTQLVFHSHPVRVDNEPRVGAHFAELLINNEAQTLTASFDERSRSFLPVGGSVDLEFGDGEAITGTVEKVESSVQADGTRGLSATISPDVPIPNDVERVKVIAEKTVANDVLLVPARSILALAGSGYALEVRTDAGLELRRIELGEFVDDLVEVSGDIAEGDEVVVPDDGIGSDQ